MTTEQFEQIITTSLSNLGINSDAHIGVAISGGADSVAEQSAVNYYCLKYYQKVPFLFSL